MRFIDEVRRRNVHRVAIVYIASSWLLIQVAETLLPVFGYFDDVLKLLVMALAIGFLPTLAISWFFEWTAKGILRENTAEARLAPRNTGTMDRIIAGALVLAVGYFAVDKFILDPKRDEARIAQAKELALASMQIDLSDEKSIAVLPFVNMSSDPEQEYFAAGMAEELLNLLTQVPGLRVVSRSTAFTYQNEQLSVPDMAEQMGVANILQGSVRKAGDQVRVSVQLIDAATDSQIWSDSFDRTFEDIFAIQNEISSQVMSQLRLQLMEGPPAAEEIDPGAYELYLQAKYIMHTSLDSSRTEEAIEKLESVLAIEPDFVPAIHELARSHLRVIQTQRLAPGQFRATLEKVKEGVARMREIAPNSGYTNGWIAFMAHRVERDYPKAAYYRERSLLTATDSIMILNLQQTADLLIELDRTAEALAVMEYVVSRDPACSYCVLSLTALIRKLGEPRAAAERMESIYQWQAPDAPLKNQNLGLAWLLADEPEKALGYFERPERTQVSAAGRLVAMFALGRIETFEKDFEALRDANEEDHAMIAAVYGAIGERDAAFQWLEKMVDAVGPGSAAIVKDEIFSSLRSDPRWERFLKKNGVREPDLSRVVFNPELPAAVQAMLKPSGNMNTG